MTIMLPVALTSAGAAALVNLWLGVRVSRVRIAEKIMVGDGGNPRLIARMRAQLNFAEYTPLVLVLIGLIGWPGARACGCGESRRYIASGACSTASGWTGGFRGE